ncbi:MAG: hypothetical protein ACXABY_31245, partial [Candidatus Thorarchaeota archaeon]
GISWIAPQLTIVIWFGTLFAYTVLAIIEELHLSKSFPTEFEEYKQRTGFLFPFVRFHNRGLEIILSTLVLAIILFAILLIPMPIPPPVPLLGTGDATVPPI